MGVPKFFRWISERYPCLSQLVQEHQIPEFDNLYLDMNGIIHVCSHPDDENVHFRLTEEDLFKSIFHYLEFLFRLIKPQKVFFMAIDGVAPRAKMNQQRSRRFRSAKTMEDQEKAARERGEKLPSSQRFDSNAITPGTEFMVKLHEQLKYFVMKKVSGDPLWRGVNVILSGHETPGEGEHKIMDFIRYERSQPDYNANTRHCLYGLDADLIMLGLTSHEPNFCLLREEVRYDNKSRQKRANIPEEMRYYLLHLSLLRDYIDHEFAELKSLVCFPYDLERVIDDWILLGFLVGNDFVPHLPALHIHEDALPYLWRVYKQTLPSLDGYLHEHGHINLDRMERYMAALGQFDEERFNERYSDSRWLMGKRGEKTAAMLDSLRDEGGAGGRGRRRGGGRRREVEAVEAPRNKKEEAVQASIAELRAEGLDEELLALVPFDDFFDDADLEADDGALEGGAGGGPGLRLIDGDSEPGPVEEEEAEEGADTERRLFLREFRQYKNDYYRHKLGVTSPNADWLRRQAREYVRALQWILRYYFEGVPSWSWFYPQHYAPFASDVKNFAGEPLTFERSTAFLPFQQLMAVLPALSGPLLPEPYRQLMSEATSPIIDFYPVRFDSDLNGKKQEWEAVVLIPFIDEHRLIAAMGTVETKLSEEERRRNAHGPHLLYRYNGETTPRSYPSSLPGVFPDLSACRVELEELHPEFHRVAAGQLVNGRHEGVRPDLYYAGFPVLNNMKHRFRLERKGVKVFNYNSRDASMILSLSVDDKEKEDEDEEEEEEEEDEDEDKAVGEDDKRTSTEAKAWMGREALLQWPHLVEGLVVQILSPHWKCTLVEEEQHLHHHKHEFTKTRTDHKDRSLYRTLTTSLTDKALLSRGLEVGRTHCLIFAKTLAGRRYVIAGDGSVRLEKQWTHVPSVFLRQRCLQRLPMAASTVYKFESVPDLYPIGATVFSLAVGHTYGCMGEVVGHADEKPRIQVKLTHQGEPDIGRLLNGVRNLEDDYLSCGYVAGKLGVSAHFVARITGSIFLYRGSQQNQERPSTDRLNVGLNIKFNKSSEELLGYSRRDTASGQWTFSMRTLELLKEYREKFPDVFLYISAYPGQDLYYEAQMMQKDDGEEWKRLKEFFDNLVTKKAMRVPHGNRQVTDELVAKLVQELDTRRPDKRRTAVTPFKPNQLFRCVASQGYLIPERGETFDLLDRVVNVRPGCTVPIGYRGTVIGVLRNQTKRETESDPSLLSTLTTGHSGPNTSAHDWSYEILFDTPFEGALPGDRVHQEALTDYPCGGGRLYRLPPYSLINLTHGQQRPNERRCEGNGHDNTDYRDTWDMLRHQRHQPGVRQQQRQLWHQAHQSYPPQSRSATGEDPDMAAAIAALGSIALPKSGEEQPAPRPQPQRPTPVPQAPRGQSGMAMLQEVCRMYAWPIPRVCSAVDPNTGDCCVSIVFPNDFKRQQWARSQDEALRELAMDLQQRNRPRVQAWQPPPFQARPQTFYNQAFQLQQHQQQLAMQQRQLQQQQPKRQPQAPFVPLQVSRKKAAAANRSQHSPPQQQQATEPPQPLQQAQSVAPSPEVVQRPARPAEGGKEDGGGRRGRRRIGAKFPGSQKS